MAEGTQRRLAAIVAADIAGFSRLVGTDEEGTLAAQRSHRSDLIEPLLSEHHGRIANTAGDSFLFEFPSAVEAMRFALAVQEGMVERNNTIPLGRRIEYRIGINVGDVVADDGDLLGDGVNVAARLEALADPGGVCISNAAHEQVRDRLEISFEDMGEVEVKNIIRPVQVYRVRADGETASVSSTPANSSWQKLAAGTVIILAIVVAGGAWWWQQQTNPKSTDTPKLTMAQRDKPSIAVLPFANLSTNKEQELFADGMTDDLITDLSKVSGLIVIARNSVFTYKGKNVKVQDVAKDLNVTHVLEGSVRKAGDRLRINAQLIDAKTGAHLWAEKYDREMKDVFAVQDELTSAITNALKIKMSLGEKQKVARKPTDNLKAYEAFLQGRKIHHELDQFDIWRAFAAYQKAVKLDPNFAEAYAEDAGLAATVYFMGFSTIFTSQQARRRYEESAKQALRLEPDNVTALRARAYMLLLDGLRNEALLIARQIVSSNPNNAAAKITLAEILVSVGKLGEGRQVMDAALRIEPKPDLQSLAVAGRVYFADSQYRKSAIFFQELARKAPKSYDGHLGLVVTSTKLGRLQVAKESLKKFLRLNTGANLHFFSVLLRHWGKHVAEPWIDALREAGLPEWPNGFEPKHEERLSGVEIRSLLFGQVMESQLSLGNNAQWEIATNGTWQGRDGFRSFNGTARVKDDLLCLADLKALMGREYCVPVFRDPNGTHAGRNEYFYPGIVYNSHFSIVE
jgi:adenylate cyclase